MNFMNRKSGRLYLILFITLLTIISCAGTTGPKVSEQEFLREKEILQKKAEEFKKAQQGKVGKVGEKLLLYIQNHPQISFHMVDDQSVNAAATFNKVFVTYGMMRFIKTEDELAVVLGHELAHITRGHLKKSITKNILLDIPVLILGTLAESQVSGTGQVVSMLGGAFSQKFNRDYEREADVYGLKYAYEAGYDIKAGARIWERFAIEVPKSLSRDFFSSHPSSPERLIRIKKVSSALLSGQGIEGLEENPK